MELPTYFSDFLTEIRLSSSQIDDSNRPSDVS